MERGGAVPKSQPSLSKTAADSRNTKMEEQLARVKDYFKIYQQFLKYKWWTAYTVDGLTPEVEAEATALDF